MNVKYHFYSKESKIFDFLQFPKLALATDEEMYKEDGEYGAPEEEFIKFVKEIREILRPFKSEIGEFYLEKFIFPERIVILHPFFDHKDVKSYIRKLETLTEDDIKQSILYDYLTFQANTGYSEEIIEKSAEIIKDKEKILECIKALKIDGEIKWKLFCIYEDPLKYMQRYIQLMKSIAPIFESIYEKYEQKIIEYGESLICRLENQGGKGLSNLTGNIISESLIEGEEINFIVSLVMSYSAMLFPCSKKSYMVWGMKTTQYFEELKLINENELNDRVAVFKNLGDKARYETLKLIATGTISTKDIAENLGLTSATISYHINNLTVTNLVRLTKVNTKNAYVFDNKSLIKSIKGLMEDFDIKIEDINKS